MVWAKSVSLMLLSICNSEALPCKGLTQHSNCSVHQLPPLKPLYHKPS